MSKRPDTTAPATASTTKPEGHAGIGDVPGAPIVAPGKSAGARPAADKNVLKIHRQLLRHLKEAQYNLLAINSVDALLIYLLQDFPAAFGFAGAELSLHDPDGELASLMSPILPSRLEGHSLNLHKDSYHLYQLYPDQLDTEFLYLDDPRMFRILSGAGEATGAVMVPLTDGNYLSGSYHLALAEGMADFSAHDKDLFSMLGQLTSSALRRVVQQAKFDQFALLDPVTELSNRRAFRRDLLREVHWARRENQPVSLLFLALTDFEALHIAHGAVASNFVQRRLGQRLGSALRATDYLSHVARGQFSVVLPSCNEPQAHAVGERLCAQVADFSVGDEHGAVFEVSVSVGLVCWDPTQLPLQARNRVAAQMEEEAESAMGKSEEAGGNTVSVARLGLLML